jgi:hypothetical protein
VCTVAVRQQPLQAMLAGALVDGLRNFKMVKKYDAPNGQA